MLDVLQQADQPLTVPEIATTARCSEITVRRQLHDLINAGDVHRSGTRPRLTEDGRHRRAGRGPYVYAPTTAPR